MNIGDIKQGISQYVEERKSKKQLKKEARLEKKKHIVAILFSTYTDIASRVVSLTSGFGYTHVSISIDNSDYFYAFNTKGFRKEYPKKHVNRTKNCIKYILEITHRQYKKLCRAIKDLEKKNNKNKLKYNWLGLFSCMVSVPIKMENRYFCSQFVAKLLEKAEIMKFKRNTSRYLPNQLNKEVRNCPLIVKRIENCFAV